MLIHCRFDRRAELSFIREHIIDHQHSVADRCVCNKDLWLPFENGFATYADRLGNIDQIRHFQRRQIAFQRHRTDLTDLLRRRSHVK